MSRNRQNRLEVDYIADLNRVRFKYSKRGITGIVGVEIVPNIVLGINPKGRVVNWHIYNPKQVLSRYIDDDAEGLKLKPDFQWKKMLDQQRIQHLINSPILAVESFVSSWIINARFYENDGR